MISVANLAESGITVGTNARVARNPFKTGSIGTFNVGIRIGTYECYEPELLHTGKHLRWKDSFEVLFVNSLIARRTIEATTQNKVVDDGLDMVAQTV